MVFLFMWFWFWFDDLVGGVRIYGVAMCWRVAWWWCGGYVFFFSVVAGAKGRGRKRGKGRESEIVKKKNKKVYLNKLGKNRV